MAHTLVTFHAHPDDESLLTAGVMAKAAAEGHRVVLVLATAGEVGDAAADYVAGADDRVGAGGDLGAARRREAARSAEILGVSRVVELGYRDSGSSPDDARRAPGCFAEADVEEAAAKLAAVLVEEQADVLTTYDANGGYGHPDHRQVHVVGARAAELAGTPVLLEATIDRDLMAVGIELATSLGYEVPDSFAPERLDDWFSPADQLTHVVDVSGQLAQKRASMAAHESQSTSAEGGPRTIAAFLSLPEEYFALAFGTEWFIEPGREPGEPLTDVFASLAP